MLNTFDLMIADLDSINAINGAYFFLCNANKITAQQVATLAPELLCESELQLLQQRKKLLAQKEYLASRFLIKTLISKQFKLPYREIHLSFNAQEKMLQAHYNGQPIAIKISLAHSKGMVFFALSDNKLPLGVDIEFQNFKRNILSVSAAFFHPNEFSAQAEPDYLKFYQLWTLKESLAKASAQSIFELLPQNTRQLLEQYQHSLGQFENFQLAAIHTSEFNPMPCYVLDLETVLNNDYE